MRIERGADDLGQIPRAEPAVDLQLGVTHGRRQGVQAADQDDAAPAGPTARRAYLGGGHGGVHDEGQVCLPLRGRQRRGGQ